MFPFFATRVPSPGHRGQSVKGLSVPDPYDVLTIAAVADELSATIGNGRIQRIGLIDSRTLGAEVYAAGQRHYLLASADDRFPRLRLASAMPSLDPALVTPFNLLLRKYARGGIILGIDQPPLERIVQISIAKRHAPLKTGEEAVVPGGDHALPNDEIGDDVNDAETELSDADDMDIKHVTLFVELMGRHSNLILIDDTGLILESAKRVNSAMSRVRTVLPRHPYTPPPPPNRLDPRTINHTEAEHFLSALPPEVDLARAFVSSYRGISPVMAREIVFRITGDTSTTAGSAGSSAAEALVTETQALLAPLQSTHWNPRVYREHEEDGAGEIAAFAVTPMAHLAASYDEVPVDSVSEAAALAESAVHRPSPMRHAQRRQRLLDSVATAREKASRRLAALAGEAARAAQVETLRMAGELIYAHLWEIEPGQVELLADKQRVALDPRLSANENAQAYFERYRKAQSAGHQLPALEAESTLEIAYLDQLATLIAQAPGFNELEALAAEWAEASAPEGAPRPRRRAAPKRPKALIDAAGNGVYIGRSGPQNDLLTFDIAGPDDTWLHARGVGGAHVIVRWRNPAAGDDAVTLEAAAALAAWYSASRESGAVEVDIARRRHVRKIKGARPGMVTYRNERTIRVRPEPETRLNGVLSER